MPLVGESAGRGWAYTTGGSYYTHTWEINLPPTAGFIKVFLGGYFEFDDQSAVHIGLMKVRRRLSNGADETISFPDIAGWAPTMVYFSPTLTHVTFGMKVKEALGIVVWTLGYWA